MPAAPTKTPDQVSFDVADHEAAVIRKIARRARALETQRGGKARSLLDWQMDVAATHANGNPLRLSDLAEADDFNFMHDVFGICRHLDRSTGALTNFFSPRFSQREAA